ncbi:uncharacterized protein N7446_000371 [Penicillium canescens]|uniref:uncharacterized protein n=1 Tax=Penicillium canescens TaxID=5083 RepID=UPI0026E10CAD|nr:uncharacterized protein N7446_000371 [Penicillium canescens]KAJ6077435.1 hypothetical protein N7446_000371 [Penicillium canescens]
MEPPNKKIRTDSASPEPESRLESSLSTLPELVTLHRVVTPPERPSSSGQAAYTDPEAKKESNGPKASQTSSKAGSIPPKIIDSPIQLTHIRDLPTSKGYNVDTVRLRDILGDPMIRECWQFNYLIDVDFLMSQFDEDTRGLVKVRVVHGSWQRESANKIRIEEACARYPNVEPIVAYMPEAFGTHHSKMMVLLRHDDLAQVVIHTANMIPMDWTNMTQAVWRSPLLPQNPSSVPETDSPIGSGSRFKRDLLAYLKAYGPSKTGPLVQQLETYDFEAVRAALVASVPSKQHASDSNSEEGTLWGWLALKDLMSRIPIKNTNQDKKRAPKSLTSSSSAAQQKQLAYMRPYLCQWAGDGPTSGTYIDLSGDEPPKWEAGRARAAPHIKTYIRFRDGMESMDWAMVSSANLSTQAWGAGVNSAGEVRICSWEIGVVVWPGLFGDCADEGGEAVMVPTFKKDRPSMPSETEEKEKGEGTASVVVGFRMPYDLPLTRYGATDEPWCATASHELPDWRGQSWIV